MRAVPSTTPRQAAKPFISFGSESAPVASHASSLSRVMPQSITIAGSSMTSGTAPKRRGVRAWPTRNGCAPLGDDRRPVRGAARCGAVGPGSHQIDDGRLQLVVRQMEHVLGVAEKAVGCQQCTELADLVEEQIRVPVLAIKFVPLDVGKHPVRQRDHLIVGRAILVRGQQLAVVLDQLLALGQQLLDRTLQGFTGLHPLDVVRQARERHRQIIVPRAVIVIETIADIDVEPGVARDLELCSHASRAHRRCHVRSAVHRNCLPKCASTPSSHARSVRRRPQLIIGPKNLRLDARHHPRDRLIGDLREGLLAESKKVR